MSYIRLAMLEDKDTILSLYNSLIGTPGCTWTTEYPTQDCMIMTGTAIK